MGGGIDEWVEVVMDNFFSFVSLVCVRERERGDGTIKIDNEKREEKGTVCLGGGTRQGRSVKTINSGENSYCALFGIISFTVDIADLNLPTCFSNLNIY